MDPLRPGTQHATVWGVALPHVRAATLLVVGSRDPTVLEFNREALGELRCLKELAIVRGATHLFEESGAMDDVIALACRWFTAHLVAKEPRCS